MPPTEAMARPWPRQRVVHARAHQRRCAADVRAPATGARQVPAGGAGGSAHSTAPPNSYVERHRQAHHLLFLMQTLQTTFVAHVPCPALTCHCPNEIPLNNVAIGKLTTCDPNPAIGRLPRRCATLAPACQCAIAHTAMLAFPTLLFLHFVAAAILLFSQTAERNFTALQL